ncbi:MAG: M17 family peptidase N-terminal domain-containing protein [Myxococcota bacterium]|jgi:hypothetical protein|nr:M17 family peptidase N-terminal domain-containing protein [Myxococcota bacterium]
MTTSLSLVLQGRPLERVTCDLVVVGGFAMERPLRGGAARLDWRLCGLLSDQIREENFSGERGEALLVATGGALRAPRALLLGLGQRDQYGPVMAQGVIAEGIGRCFELGVCRVAMAPLGIASSALPEYSASLIGGLREAARDRSGPFELEISVPSREHEAAQASLERAIRAIEPTQICLQVGLNEPADLGAPHPARPPGGSSTPRL